MSHGKGSTAVGRADWGRPDGAVPACPDSTRATARATARADSLVERERTCSTAALRAEAVRGFREGCTLVVGRSR